MLKYCQNIPHVIQDAATVAHFRSVVNDLNKILEMQTINVLLIRLSILNKFDLVSRYQ